MRASRAHVTAMASRLNQNTPRGVLHSRPAMEALLGDCAEAAVTPDDTLEREFVGRLEEASRLAFRVALGVLHNREDAEDIAQEALVRAYRNFGGCATASASRRGWSASPGGWRSTIGGPRAGANAASSPYPVTLHRPAWNRWPPGASSNGISTAPWMSCRRSFGSSWSWPASRATTRAKWLRFWVSPKAQ